MSNNFCIMRFEKIKTWNDVQARARHNNRTIPLENTNVNTELAKQNIRGGNIYDPAMIRQHYSNVVKNLKKKPRPDAVKAIEIVATFSNTAKNCLTPDQQKDYFQDALTALDDKFGADNRMGFWIHYDEATPHLHAFYIPVHDGKLNCKHYLGGDISAFQTEFYEKTGAKYGLDRGVRREESLKHKTLKDFRDALLKKGVEMDDIEQARAGLLAAVDEIENARAGLLAMGAANEMENERLAQEKRNLEADRKKIEAQAKRNHDETLNLQRIRKFLDDNASAKVEAYKRIQEKWLKDADAKIQRLNELARVSEEIKTYLDMENGIETIQSTDWVAEMEKHEMKPTGYIKTALEAPQEGAQAPGQGGYSR